MASMGGIKNLAKLLMHKSKTVVIWGKEGSKRQKNLWPSFMDDPRQSGLDIALMV